MKTRNILVVTACTLLLFSIFPVITHANEVHVPENQTAETTESYQASSISFWVKKAFQYAFKQTPSNWLVFNRDPIIEEHERTTTVSSGTIKFNTDSRGPTYVRKDLVFDEYAGQDAWIWGSRAPLFTGKIIVEVFDPGSPDYAVSSAVLQPLQQHHFDPNTLGSWYIRWSTSESDSWNLFFTYRHRYKQLPEPYVAPVEPVEYVNINDKMYLKPSSTHKQEFNTFSVKTNYNLDDLFNELWDSELGDFVYEFKNFNAGDTIHFKDTLAAIHYDPAKNVTYLDFTSEKWEDVSWPFKGDLTELFNPGDIINLKFTVEQIDGQFEILDYIRMDYNNEVANINDFLLEES